AILFLITAHGISFNLSLCNSVPVFLYESWLDCSKHARLSIYGKKIPPDIENFSIHVAGRRPDPPDDLVQGRWRWRRDSACSVVSRSDRRVVLTCLRSCLFSEHAAAGAGGNGHRKRPSGTVHLFA